MHIYITYIYIYIYRERERDNLDSRILSLQPLGLRVDRTAAIAMATLLYTCIYAYMCIHKRIHIIIHLVGLNDDPTKPYTITPLNPKP